uniref:uridine/cytidine kinase n=1 Tax=Parastrongyloides trichosuri TaxID=131310 RepID=A0A0N4ZAK7_PARTI
MAEDGKTPDINVEECFGDSTDSETYENKQETEGSCKITTMIRKRQTSTSKIDDILESQSRGKMRRAIYTHGRPPWFDGTGKKPSNAFIIGICGGSSSGKTTVATNIVASMGLPWVNIITMDSFYKILTPEQRELAAKDDYNFDVPDALEMDLVLETLQKLKVGNSAIIPQYCFTTHSRIENASKIHYGSDVIIFEGILAFYDKRIRDMMDVKVFVDADADVRLARRLKRDTELRGRTPQSVLNQYTKFVKPAYEKYCEEFKSYADIIANNNTNDISACRVAVDFIVRKCEAILKDKGYVFDKREDSPAYNIYLPDEVLSSTLPRNLVTTEKPYNMNGVYKQIKESIHSKADFIKISEKIMRQIGNDSINKYKDDNKPNTVISYTVCHRIIENSINYDINNIQQGDMLVKIQPLSNIPELFSVNLPRNVHIGKCFLMDPIISSGSVLMAIRVLLDHHVKENDIYICGILMSDKAAKLIAYAYPNITMIVMDLEKKSKIDALKPGIYQYFD